MTNDLINHNPMLKKPVCTALRVLCSCAPCDQETALRALSESWDSSFSRTPAATLEILVRNGLVSRQVSVDGQPYAGELHDLQADETVSAEAEVDVTLDVTERGGALLSSLDPARTLGELMESKPEYQSVFKRLLAAAASPAGASRSDMEAAAEAEGSVVSSTGQRVYPQYFMDALESSGGLSWDGIWRTTEAGKALIS